jgi:hypothetical protein
LTGNEAERVKKTKAGFILRDDLQIGGDLIAEFEMDKIQYPKAVGKLYIVGDWFDVDRARRLRNFLNEILPP